MNGEKTDAISCAEFVGVLASGEPVPGGGGASALAGAIGMALGNMVGSLTEGKAKYADVQDDIIELNRQAQILEARLLELIERDAEVFRPLSEAYGLPRGTEEEKAHKASIMEACLQKCAQVPLEIMGLCAQCIELHDQYAQKGAAIAISDVGCGVIICKAALQAASLNVFINTRSMADRDHAEKLNAETNSLLATYTIQADHIFSEIAGRLS
jgi:formiminotetrahydrofolate cyclodeaminase